MSTNSTQAAQAEQTARLAYHAHLEGCTEGCLPNGEQHCPEGAGLLCELASAVTEGVQGVQVAVAVLLLAGIVAAWRVPMLPVVKDGYLTVTLACLVEGEQ